MVKKQAEVITYDFENELWSKNLLGESNPDKLRDTVMFLIDINYIYLGLVMSIFILDVMYQTNPPNCNLKEIPQGKSV